MKKILVSLVALVMLIPAGAQNNASKIFSLTPALPSAKALLEDYKEQHTPYGGYNSPGGNPLQAFLDKHLEAEHQIQELPSDMKPDLSSLGRMNAGSARSSAMGNLNSMGLSAADIAKLQNENLSEEEQLALANKVMKAQGGMTSDDLAKMQKMMEAQNSKVTATEEEAAEAARLLSNVKPRSSSVKGNALLQMNEMDRTLIESFKEGDNRKEAARQQGYELYEKKYRSQIIEIEKGLRQAIMEGALDEIPARGTEARCAAAAKRFEQLTKQRFALECKFYEEYLPIWRNAIAGAMEYYKTEVLKLSEEREAFRQQQFAMTGSTEFMAPAFTPEAVAQQYFDLAKDIVDYELELPDDSVSME